MAIIEQYTAVNSIYLPMGYKRYCKRFWLQNVELDKFVYATKKSGVRQHDGLLFMVLCLFFN